MEWESLTDGSYKGIRFHCSKPSKTGGVHGVTSQKTSLERRLQLIKYPAKDGAKISDFGADSDIIEFDILFFGIDYLKKYDEFLKVANNGEPGILVCPVRPRAVVAFFQKKSDVVEVGSGGTIKVSFTFIEDTTIDPNELTSPTVSSIVSSADKAKSLGEKIADAKKVLNNNPLIGAVREIQSGISTVRRYAGAVIALDQNIRNRILSVTDEINGTLDLLNDAVAVFQKEKKSTTNPQNFIDSDTGLEVVPFDQEETEVLVLDPLVPVAASSINSDTVPELSINNLNSNAGLEVFSSKSNEILKEKRDEISTLGGGETEDVTKSLSRVVLAVDEFKNSVTIKTGSPVVVPRDLCMMEIMFFNDVPMDKLKETISNNRHIDDVLLVPAGSVVYI